MRQHDAWPWYITDKAIEDAAELLGYDLDHDAHWAYLEKLLGGLGFIARKKKDKTDTLEQWVCGQPHKRLQLLVSTRSNPEGPKPQLVGVRPPYRGWRRPPTPLRLPVLQSYDDAKALGAPT